MIRPPNLARSLALAGLGLAGCVGSPFTLVYCEDEAAQVRHCDCSRAPREVLGGRFGSVDVRVHGRGGALERHYGAGRDLQFVLRGRWLVLRVDIRNPRPTSLQTWLECDDAVIPGEVVRRAVTRDPSGVHEHEFLALFTGSAGPMEAETPICRMHVVVVDENGWKLTRMAESVYLVDHVIAAGPVEGSTWGVTIADDPAPMPGELRGRLAPPPPPPEPQLCRADAAGE